MNSLHYSCPSRFIFLLSLVLYSCMREHGFIEVIHARRHSSRSSPVVPDSIAFVNSLSEGSSKQSCSYSFSPCSSTSLCMVFDFFKKRATEGLSQLSNLSDKARQGKLSEGILDVATYTTQTNKAFTDGLAKSRNKFLYDLEAVFSGDSSSSNVYQTLEDVLIQSDIGLTTATEVVSELKSLRENSIKIISKEDLTSVLRGTLIEVLSYPPLTPTQPYERSIRFESSSNHIHIKRVQEQQLPSSPSLSCEDTMTESPSPSTISSSSSAVSTNVHIPTVLFIMGANGMGKTTTIGKLAYRLRTEGGQKVLLAACDTFRAGAVEQLMLWADRAGVDCYGPPPPSSTVTSSTTTSTSNTNTKITSPSAVLYGALDQALQERYDTLIVDTSGRLSNNEALTEELMKMKRVIQKRLSIEKRIDPNTGTVTSLPNTHVPHETLLVIDAAQGRMALESARVWNKQLELTGLILTKLDGSARGGSVVAVSRELGLPVKLVGVGEKLEDLRDFDPETFVDSLLGIGKAGNKIGDSTSKSSEAAMLSNRLKEMRKSRDERSKAMKMESSVEKRNMSPVTVQSSSVSAEIKSPPIKKKKKSKGK